MNRTEVALVAQKVTVIVAEFSFGAELPGSHKGVRCIAQRLRIEHVRRGVADLAQILHDATRQVAIVVKALGRHDHIMDKCIEINRLENESDRVSRMLIAQLFDEEKDPVQIIKWKEIIEVIEAAVDKCEDVANVIETVTLKNA